MDIPDSNLNFRDDVRVDDHSQGLVNNHHGLMFQDSNLNHGSMELVLVNGGLDPRFRLDGPTPVSLDVGSGPLLAGLDWFMDGTFHTKMVKEAVGLAGVGVFGSRLVRNGICLKKELVEAASGHFFS